MNVYRNFLELPATIKKLQALCKVRNETEPSSPRITEFWQGHFSCPFHYPSIINTHITDRSKIIRQVVSQASSLQMLDPSHMKI